MVFFQMTPQQPPKQLMYSKSKNCFEQVFQMVNNLEHFMGG